MEQCRYYPQRGFSPREKDGGCVSDLMDLLSSWYSDVVNDWFDVGDEGGGEWERCDGIRGCTFV